jgi:1-acyl-sn-glycerol-3-phosphate acyltransferase
MTLPREKQTKTKNTSGPPVFGNRFSRAIGQGFLNCIGWKVVGEVPAINKAVLVAAPHTSNWDFIIAMAAMMAKQVKLSYLMKKEAFFWPFKELFMSFGGIPIDRSEASDIVDQIKYKYEHSDALWVAITPEGTRTKVSRWKTGFLRIAIQAQVPIVIIAWDYPSKQLHLDKVWWPQSELDDEADKIREYISSHFTGRHPDRQ